MSYARILLAVLLCAGAGAPQTPEDEVLAMLREWRALRAATGDAPARVVEPEQIQPRDGSTGFPRRIRVGGAVQHGRLQSRVDPVCPSEDAAGGRVAFIAVIGRDGSVQSLQVASGDPALIPGAAEATKSWKYLPTLLNGTPVEVVTRIEVTCRVPDAVER